MAGPQLVLFSHVDSVLSEPAGTPVVNAVSLLARLRVPLVVCSGRTRAEIEHATLALGTRHPFICEGGNALFIPRGYFPFDIDNSREIGGYDVVEFGRRYRDVVNTLHRSAERAGVQVRGFDDMSADEIAEDDGGLSTLVAPLAKLRDYSELFRLPDDAPADLDRLCAALDAARLTCIRGERYHHVGAAVDASLGTTMLCVMYRRAYGPIQPVAIARDASDAAGHVVPTMALMESETPAAWAACVSKLLEARERPKRVADGAGGRLSWIL
jgi:predicted mannosyl-3-phosphoglycerate phosphatase (HAD superfamily)